MLPRVLVAAALRAGERHALDADQLHHLVRVLRLDDGSAVQAFDGAGARHEARLVRAADGGWAIELGAAQPAVPDGPLHLALAQCLSTAEKMDWTIEKAVELGARCIVPLASRRSAVRLDAARAARKHAHWQRIVEAACRQSGVDRLPTLQPLAALDDWLARAGDDARCGRRLVLDPLAATSLSSLGAPLESVTLLVGPEAGLDAHELARAHAASFEPVRLGPRVLRTETAGLAALAALQFGFGDF